MTAIAHQQGEAATACQRRVRCEMAARGEHESELQLVRQHGTEANRRHERPVRAQSARRRRLVGVAELDPAKGQPGYFLLGVDRGAAQGRTKSGATSDFRGGRSVTLCPMNLTGSPRHFVLRVACPVPVRR